MHVRLASTGFLLAAGLLSLGTAAPALAVCDAYSGTCATPAPDDAGGSSIDGGTQTPSKAGGGTGGSADRPATLPFTGGELVLLTAVGAGALAGGTALVVAGRRKASPAL